MWEEMAGQLGGGASEAMEGVCGLKRAAGGVTRLAARSALRRSSFSIASACSATLSASRLSMSALIFSSTSFSAASHIPLFSSSASACSAPRAAPSAPRATALRALRLPRGVGYATTPSGSSARLRLQQKELQDVYCDLHPHARPHVEVEPGGPQKSAQRLRQRLCFVRLLAQVGAALSRVRSEVRQVSAPQRGEELLHVPG